MKNFFGFDREKIYKIVYRVKGLHGYGDDRTILLTARDPAAAIKIFNSKCEDNLVDIKEFIEVTVKGDDSK